MPSVSIRKYVVQAGDSPAGIASRDDMAGCPKCGGADLVRANPHKEFVVHRNGFTTFKELCVGEILILPNKWFHPRFELLPPAYFACLPYTDGVTPSPFGSAAPGILRDFRALDVAADRLCALLTMDNHAFARHLPYVAEAIGTAVEPAVGQSRYAMAATDAVRTAAVHNRTFGPYLATGLPTGQARKGVEESLALALDSACRALGEMYGSVQPPGH